MKEFNRFQVCPVYISIVIEVLASSLPIQLLALAVCKKEKGWVGVLVIVLRGLCYICCQM